MKKYYKKPKTVKINLIKNTGNALSAPFYRQIICINKNTKKLESFIVNNDKGFEPGSDKYIKFGDALFIRITEMNSISYSFSDTNSTLKIIPSVCENTIEFGDICYQTASDVGNVNVYFGKKAGYNSHIRKLIFNEKRYYLLAFLKSNFCKFQVESFGSIKGVDNFNETRFNKTIIPFPTKKNNNNPELVEKEVELLVRNIIDKELQIKEKKSIINNIIRKNIEEKQSPNQFSYNLPKISEIKKIGRLDTGMYEKKYKESEWKIKNSIYEKFSMSEDDLSGGKTPKIRIFEPSEKKYVWFTPTDMNRGELTERHYIKALSYNLGDKFALLFSNRSNCGDCILYDPNAYKYGGHHNQGIYRKEFDKEEFKENIFILCLFNSEFYQDMISHIATGANFLELRMSQYADIDLPNFPDDIKEDLLNLYYKDSVKNENLNFDNYLQIEKERNKKLGIFQLNMELFSLKEKLEDIIDKIIMEEPINIDLSY